MTTTKGPSLVERMSVDKHATPPSPTQVRELLREAASYITELEGEIEAAKEALRQFEHVAGEPLSETASVAASAFDHAKHRAEAAETRITELDGLTADLKRALDEALTAALGFRARTQAAEANSARLEEAARAADEALTQFAAFEDDARYIMGNTNFAIVQACREQVRAALEQTKGESASTSGESAA